MGNPRTSRCADRFRRLLATVCAGLVFALGLFAVSPTLHEKLHDHATSSADDGCAVVLFAGGISVPVTATAPPPPQTQWQEYVRIGAAEFHLESPRYLLQPERGPPVG